MNFKDDEDLKAFISFGYILDTAYVLRTIKTVFLLLNINWEIEDQREESPLRIKVPNKDVDLFQHFHVMCKQQGLFIYVAFSISSTTHIRVEKYYFKPIADASILTQPEHVLFPERFIWKRKTKLNMLLSTCVNYMKERFYSFSQAIRTSFSKQKNKLIRRKHTCFSVVLVAVMLLLMFTGIMVS